MRILLRLFLVVICLSASSLHGEKPMTDRQAMRMQEKIRKACRHAWTGYMTHARGFDALRPLSRTGHNWYPVSFQMTPVDAYDTFILLGMEKEAQEASQLIFDHLRFDIDQEVQLFEMSIRVLGGLLSSYELSGQERFRTLAEDLGRRLLPAFASPTGMPWRFVNLATGAVRDPNSNPAEIGTYLLEFGKLTQITGDSVFYLTARKAALEVFRRRSDLDLPGTVINVETGDWRNTESQVGARIDSYYEYLFKSWLMFGDRECLDAWKIHARAVNDLLLKEVPAGWYYTRADMKSGKEKRPLYGSLEAFYAGLLALSGDTATAGKVQEGNFRMWTRFGIEPEEFNFRTGEVTDPSYVLRPENLESCFYLFRITGDPEYRHMGRRMVLDLLKKCRTDAGFASLNDVRTGEHADGMESFFLAETLKYAWLLFDGNHWPDLRQVVFTTEAHPLKVVSRPAR